MLISHIGYSSIHAISIGFPIRRAPEGLIKDVRPHLACAVCYITYWDLYSLCGKAASCILTTSCTAMLSAEPLRMDSVSFGGLTLEVCALVLSTQVLLPLQLVTVSYYCTLTGSLTMRT